MMPDSNFLEDLVSLRDGFKNRDAAEVYGRLSPDEIKKQIRDVVSKKGDVLKRIREVSQKIQLGNQDRNEIEQMLSRRIDDLALASGILPADIGKINEPVSTSTVAGILVYAPAGVNPNLGIWISKNIDSTGPSGPMLQIFQLRDLVWKVHSSSELDKI